MKLIRLLTASIILMALAIPAYAATDLGNGQCVQDDGQAGRWDGSSADDAGCITEAEYVAMTSPEGLVASGAIAGATDNGDGTSTLNHHSGVTVTVKSDPLTRPVAATPSLEPDAPTIGEVLFGRATVGVHPI